VRLTAGGLTQIGEVAAAAAIFRRATCGCTSDWGAPDGSIAWRYGGRRACGRWTGWRPCGPAMDRFPCAWTAHDAPAPKLATTPALPSRQGALPLRPASPTSNPSTHPQAQFVSSLAASPATTAHGLPQPPRLHTKTSPNLFASGATTGPTPKQNPLKTRHHPAV